MPAIPSWTVEGAFGIARTTGTPGPRSGARSPTVGIAAATESTVCSGSEQPADLAEQDVEILRLDREDDHVGAAIASALEVPAVHAVPLVQLGRAAPRRGPVTTMSARQPELSRPASSDSPIVPAPRIAIRAMRPGHRRV